MSQTQTQPLRKATKQIHISPELYRELRHVLADTDGKLQDVADQIIERGLRLYRADKAAASPN
jgi:hypothetical protein